MAFAPAYRVQRTLEGLAGRPLSTKCVELYKYLEKNVPAY